MAGTAQEVTSASRRRIRSDIQALRAIAVGLVILDHLAILQKLPGHPEGGVIGVDVFFVISGFLITQHLVSEVRRDGRISFRNFYIRRARRILPMAILVIVVTVLAGYLVFWPWQAASSAADGLWSALFVSNIAFAVRGVDYFSADQTSIFQHYWSLSVEEQFYIVWPVLIVVTALVAFKKFGVTRSLVATTVTVGVLSLVWACVDTATSPTSAYFSTFSRGFEFAVGGLLAVLASRLSSIRASFRPWLSLAGVIVIFVSVWGVNPVSGFPGPMALLPVAGAAMYIAAGTGAPRDVQIWPLRTRAVTYVGDISYSLYLWHWPVIMILLALVPRESIVIPAALVLTVALSAASYRFIERPIGKSVWLIRPRKTRRFTRSVVRRNVAWMVGVLVVVAGGIAAGDYTLRTFVSSGNSAAASVQVRLQEGQPEVATALVEQMQIAIADGADRQTWDNLKPAISDIANYGAALTTDCWTSADSEPRTCLRGDPAAEHTIVVFGDSIAMNAAFGVDAFIEEHPDWNLRVFAKLGCAAQQVPASAPGGGPYTSCEEFREWAVSEIHEIGPDAIWLTSALPRTMPDVSADDVVEVWDRGLFATLSELEGAGETFVVMPPPAGEDLAFCSRPYNTPGDCGSRISERWIQVRDSSAATTQAVDARLVDTAMWFCDENGACPAVIGDYIVRRDERHLTYDFGSSLGSLVAAWVLGDY